MVNRRYGLPLGDFPDVGKFRSRLREVKDLRRFPKLEKSMVYEMDRVFSVDIPRLLEKASYKPGGGKHHHQQHQQRGGRR